VSFVTDARPVLLYVEDDVDTFKLAELRLRSRYQVVHAQNDREACAQVVALAPTLHGILMDIELQGSQLDGLDLVRLVRGYGLSRSRPEFSLAVPTLSVPIVMLTAHVGRYSEADARAVGATDFITKPIDFTRLTLALARHHIASVMTSLSVAPARRP
jgi:CheY-like chemotaxis protein